MLQIVDVGFYDSYGVYFFLNPMNGFHPNSYECACRPIKKYVARVFPDTNEPHPVVEIEISKDMAYSLCFLYEQEEEQRMKKD